MASLKKMSKILLQEGLNGLIKAYVNSCKRRKEEAKLKRKAKSFHLISEEERNHQKRHVFQKEVLFSIITPLYNTPENYLNELIGSLERQTYGKWQLCIADGSDKEHGYVGEVCRRWQEKDSRIVYSSLLENKGISANTNACLQLAAGEYYGLLDHDDVLHESALYEMMKIIEKTEADFLYSDEVKFSGKIEEAIDFNFKSGYGKDELRSHNYICHFTVFSKKLLEKEKVLYRPEFDGSQDHDMVLRLTEKAQKIVHVPKVLYYWRVHPESVSMNLDSKSYAVDAAIRAVEEQLKRSGEYGVVRSNLPYRTMYRIKYEIREKEKVIILLFGLSKEKILNNIAKSISEQTFYQNYKFVILAECDDNVFAERMNQCIKENMADYYVLMNEKCVPTTSDWIEEMLMFAQRKDVCAVSPKIIFDDETICFGGMALDYDSDNKVRFLFQGKSNKEQGYEAMLRIVRNITSVWRGCCMISAATFEELGGFDPYAIGYEEIDFSVRGVEKKFWNVWTPFVEIRYKGTVKEVRIKGNTAYFTQKWEKRLEQGDIYLHFHLKELKWI